MDNITFFIQSFVAFFAIIDAIGNIPIFISLLEGFTEEDRKTIIRRATWIAMMVLLIVTFTGRYIFFFLNINMFSFKIAGGILLMIISIEMLFGKKTRTETSEDIEERKHDLTVTPLAIPLLTGPGALTTGIVLLSSAQSLPNPEIKVLLLVLSILLSFFVSYWLLIKARRVAKYFGKTGTRVIVRVMGLLLLSIAVQFIIAGAWNAIEEIMKNPRIFG